MNPALRTMLAFDIETTGTDPAGRDNDGEPIRITCACVCDGNGYTETFLFKGEDAAEDQRLREQLVARLDAAPRLCAFNGIRFDIPFMVRSWGLPAAVHEAWVRKTVDVFEASKLALGRTFPLSKLLSANGLESKSGTGLHAIHLAKTGQWQELGDYCMQDTRLTHAVSSQYHVRLPLHVEQQAGVQRAIVYQPLNAAIPFCVW